MNKLLVLAYNEENKIEEAITSQLDIFDEIIVVNDKSKDGTKAILEELSLKHKKIVVINNDKNLGPGRSMEIGINYSIKSSFNFLVKIDGDNQFDKEDVVSILESAKKYNADYIKCDRFWVGGVKGKIPKIRYFGNAIASLLIKLVTGNRKINDPLNGLFLFSENIAKEIKLPRFFYRYGYPFFINAFISKLNIENSFKLYQYKNKITYGNEQSKLNPVTVFVKLILFTFSFFFSTIKTKLRYSTHQLSGLVDVISVISFFLSIFSIYMVIITRYFNYDGNQGAWSLLFVIFLIIFFMLLFQSQKILKPNNEEEFIYIN